MGCTLSKRRSNRVAPAALAALPESVQSRPSTGNAAGEDNRQHQLVTDPHYHSPTASSSSNTPVAAAAVAEEGTISLPSSRSVGSSSYQPTTKKDGEQTPVQEPTVTSGSLWAHFTVSVANTPCGGCPAPPTRRLAVSPSESFYKQAVSR